MVDLLVEQIEFADVVILNKVSTATDEQRDAARKIIVALNLDAKLIEADFGKVELKEVLGTGRFDFAKAETHPLWYKELHGFKDHIPETEEYGIRSFFYRAKKPFDPMKFQAFIDRAWFEPRASSGWQPGRIMSAKSARRGTCQNRQDGVLVDVRPKRPMAARSRLP